MISKEDVSFTLLAPMAPYSELKAKFYHLVDYNSWIESDEGRELRKKLPIDTVLAEGYNEFNTSRTYLALMGDWRRDKDVEVELDGIGGVTILVKADVHRAGTCLEFLGLMLGIAR